MESACLNMLGDWVAISWMDGSMRIFHVTKDSGSSSIDDMGAINSILSNITDNTYILEPLLGLNGHSNCPITISPSMTNLKLLLRKKRRPFGYCMLVWTAVLWCGTSLPKGASFC